jgi:hypothetical protein
VLEKTVSDIIIILNTLFGNSGMKARKGRAAR